MDEPMPSVNLPLSLNLKNMTQSDTVVWVAAMLMVGVLVGLGRLDPKMVEYMLFAVAGRVVSGKSTDTSVPPSLPPPPIQ